MSQYPPKGQADYLQLGDWNADCFFCGRKFKASELKKHWQGFYLCTECWEPRHPQDFVRGVPDKPAAPWVQTAGDTFVTDFCDLEGISCIADVAIADCAICDYVPPSLELGNDQLSLSTEDDQVLLLTDEEFSILI